MMPETEQSGPYGTAPAQLRRLIPEVVRRYEERVHGRDWTGVAVPGDLPVFLEHLADAMASGGLPETALLGASQPDASLDRAPVPSLLDGTLQGYQLLQRILTEVVEAEAPLAQAARFFIEDAFHAAEREAVRARAMPEEQLVRDSEEQLRALVDSNIVGVVRSNLDGRIFDANDAFLNLTGYSRADLSAGNLDWREITPSDYREVDEQTIARVQSTGRCDLYEKEYVRKDGTRVTALVGRALVNPQRGDCVTYVLDQTRRLELENALRDRAEEAGQANERLNQFLAMIAHELRTPLSIISNALYLLESHSLSDKAARQVSIATRQTRHATRLVGDLIDLTRIARGKLELRREPLLLRRIAADAIESARPLMDSFGHQLITDYPSESLIVEADPLRIEQIINNLLTNAAKYTDPGGCIRLSIQRRGQLAVLCVRDNGRGIDPAKLSRIFDLYEQFGLSEARSHGGLGIGLPLVKRLVELHGGTVSARSEGPGQGSEFEVAFPLVDNPGS